MSYPAEFNLKPSRHAARCNPHRAPQSPSQLKPQVSSLAMVAGKTAAGMPRIGMGTAVQGPKPDPVRRAVLRAIELEYHFDPAAPWSNEQRHRPPSSTTSSASTVEEPGRAPGPGRGARARRSNTWTWAGSKGPEEQHMDLGEEQRRGEDDRSLRSVDLHVPFKVKTNRSIGAKVYFCVILGAAGKSFPALQK
jgi:hypothetical protein